MSVRRVHSIFHPLPQFSVFFCKTFEFVHYNFFNDCFDKVAFYRGPRPDCCKHTKTVADRGFPRGGCANLLFWPCMKTNLIDKAW